MHGHQQRLVAQTGAGVPHETLLAEHEDPHTSKQPQKFIFGEPELRVARAGFVHPRSLALLAREGISTAGLCSKSWDDLPMRPDIVITVCGNAAGETCPAYLGQALRAHWGVEDPAKAVGTDAQIDHAFEEAYRILRARIEAFLALPLETLVHEPKHLERKLAAIGKLDATQSNENH